MKKKTQAYLGPIEWDFRGIPAEEIEDAIIYEYSRTSGRISNPITSWLDSDWRGEKVRLMLAKFQCKWGREAGYLIPQKLENAAKRVIRDPRLYDMIIGFRADFPAPWEDWYWEKWRKRMLRMVDEKEKAGMLAAKTDTERKKVESWALIDRSFVESRIPLFVKVKKLPSSDSSVHCCPLRDTLGRIESIKSGWVEIGIDDRGWPIERRNLQNEIDSTYALRIHWKGNSFGQILTEIERYLRSEAKKHPGMKQRGKPAQLQVFKLRQLAALRLHNAGFTHEQAKNLITKDNKDKMLIQHRIIPFYEGAPEWSDAIKAAKKELHRLENLPSKNFNWKNSK